MTTANCNAWLRAQGYIPAGETMRLLKEFRAAGVPFLRVAKLTGVPGTIVAAVGIGHQKSIRREHAERIADLSVDEARECMKPYVDPVLMDRIIRGASTTIPFGEKKMYARELCKRGWNRAQIGTTLAMSGTSVREALTSKAQAA